MGKATLVDEDINGGRLAFEALEQGGLPIAAAMWLKTPESGWQYYIASPDVQAHGPIVVYKFIHAVLQAANVPIPLDDVVAANTTNHFINSVASAIGISGGITRVTNCNFNGVHVEDAVAYKIRKGVKASPKPRVAKQSVLTQIRDYAA
jgi:hypothetical protein